MISTDEIRDQYPFASKFLKIDGFQYHYIDEGQGEPVVMIHGNPTWSYYFRNLIKSLSPHYRTIAPDHIGMGLSSKPRPEDYSFRLIDRVDNLGRLLDHLKLNNITLVLHDWGGMIGLTWARKNRDRVKRLILLNTAGFHLPNSRKLPLALRLCRNTKWGASLVLRANGFTRAANQWCTTRPLSRDTKRAYLLPHPHYRDRTAILRFVQDIPLNSADPSFYIVTETQASLRTMQHIPTLILWGAQDFVFDDHFLSEWHGHFPHAEFHRFADAGHYVLEDEPTQCLEYIKGFLDKNPLISVQ